MAAMGELSEPVTLFLLQEDQTLDICCFQTSSITSTSGNFSSAILPLMSLHIHSNYLSFSIISSNPSQEYLLLLYCLVSKKNNNNNNQILKILNMANRCKSSAKDMPVSKKKGNKFSCKNRCEDLSHNPLRILESTQFSFRMYKHIYLPLLINLHSSVKEINIYHLKVLPLFLLLSLVGLLFSVNFY